MISIMIPLMVLWAKGTNAEDYYYNPQNLTKATLSGIAAYRSALTLDWLAAEDQRQRELAAAFETEPAPPARSLSTDCISYARPASGKVARLMLELLKNLEGDEGNIVTDLIQALVRTKLLVETSMLDAEPDLDSLVKTPGVMMGEPHTTFPRILAMTWMTVTDPVTTKKFGWCPINKVNKYLTVTKPITIAKQMKALEPVIARARFIMEEFIQHVTPLNMYQKKSPEPVTNMAKLYPEDDNNIAATTTETHFKSMKRPTRTVNTVRAVHVALAQSGTTPQMELEHMPRNVENEILASSSQISLCHLPHTPIIIFLIIFYVINMF
ncbi:uncharacterized protein LOC111354380 [Spodoptera litura]|uniref:Uncharacterized protein LOC111354380 n=1 Tax=Spodoptera litura TaxID=69820 RepID=A0A9J7IQ54_SPOLT|nr:uncharacterized protein LOC111354380 [Spodoptera litura]